MSTPKGKLWILRKCCPRKEYDESVDSVTTYFSPDKKHIIKGNVNNTILRNTQITTLINIVFPHEKWFFCVSQRNMRQIWVHIFQLILYDNTVSSVSKSKTLSYPSNVYSLLIFMLCINVYQRFLLFFLLFAITFHGRYINTLISVTENLSAM